METRKDIPGYEGYYQASTLGDIRSIQRTTTKGGILKPGTTRGYLRATLSKNGITKSYQVNRLVALTFIPNPANLPEVNHKNGIKTDNRVENLEWMTKSENKQHAYDVLGLKCYAEGKFGSKHQAAKKVNQYTKNGEFIKTRDSIIEAANYLGIRGISHIGACCRGNNKTAGGYKWSFTT